jgi:hypothetical protein
VQTRPSQKKRNASCSRMRVRAASAASETAAAASARRRRRAAGLTPAVHTSLSIRNSFFARLVLFVVSLSSLDSCIYTSKRCKEGSILQTCSVWISGVG